MGITIAIFSLISYFIGFQITLVKDTGLATRVLHTLLYQLDLTHETTFVTWFLSLMILLCAIGFLLIGWGDKEKLKISSARQGVIKLFCVITLFLALDEILCLQDQLVHISEYSIGFARLFVYLPLALIGMVMFIYIFNQLIKNIRTKKHRVLTNHYFKSVIILALIYFILVVGEQYLLATGYSIKLIPYMEEFIKLGMIYCVYSLLLKVTDNYNL